MKHKFLIGVSASLLTISMAFSGVFGSGQYVLADDVNEANTSTVFSSSTLTDDVNENDESDEQNLLEGKKDEAESSVENEVYNNADESGISGTSAENGLIEVDEEEDKKKAPFHQTSSIDDVSITVDADPGVIPSGTTLNVKKVSKSDYIEKAVSEARDDDRNVAASYTLDISLTDEAGNEIEPDISAGNVRVTLDCDLIANKNLEPVVYHIPDEVDPVAEKLDVIDSDSTSVTVETDGFSYYTVEFTYGEFKYILEANEEVEISDISEKLGLNGDIINARGTNNDCFETYVMDGKWFVKAKQAFSSNESLYVKYNTLENEIIIRVDSSSASETWYTDYEYERDVTKHELKLTKYVGTKTEIIIPAKSTLDGTEYKTILSGEVYSNKNKLKSILLEQGVCLEGDVSNMFSGLYWIEKLNFSGVDTSKVTSMHRMFYNCNNLKKLDVVGFDTSLVEDMSEMFSNCPALKELDVSRFNTSMVRDMSGMFSYCMSLKELNLSRFISSHVSNMNGMFWGCKNLEKIDGLLFNTSNVTDMRYMFSQCETLEVIDVSNFITSNVTEMDGMFSGCHNLKQVDISSFDTSQCRSLSNLFCDCKSLKELDLSSLDTSKVTVMDGMFQGCLSLERIDLTGFNTANVTTMSGMFDACEKLKLLDLSSFDMRKVSNILLLFTADLTSDF